MNASRNVQQSTVSKPNSKRFYPSPFNNQVNLISSKNLIFNLFFLFIYYYYYQLMLSEWLEQIDNEDLEKNWIMCLCPIGKRCLVVASEGCTSVYNKGGKLIARHSSKLPGGSRDSKTGWV